jgi:malonyl-CoA/methylmalonyl-CoA synthetase
MSHNLFSRIRAGLGEHLADPFVVEADGGGQLSYGAMIERTGRLANALRSLGVAPGDRIAVQADKSTDGLLLYLASLRAGAVYLPLNPAYTTAEVSYFLGDAEPVLFVCSARNLQGARDLAAASGTRHVRTLDDAPGTGLVADLESFNADFNDADRAAGDLAAILYTSGTTGRSKGAMLSHGNLWSNAATLRDYWRFTPQDRLIHALPIFHTHGLFVATNLTLLAGASMVLLPRFDVRAIMRHLREASVLMGVPTFYTRLLKEPDFDRDLTANMRLFVSGSAPLSPEIHREFTARTGHAILERYGMTETNMNTSNPYDGARVPGSVGLPLPGVEVRIADPETGRPIADGPGSIEVRGPNVFGGYWRMPERTAQEFRADGFFVTGDLGYRDARGYIYIAGRAKDLIISGGFNIYPAEVENTIDAIAGVEESAVIGVPHADLGEAAVAIVTRKPDSTIGEDDVIAALANALAPYKRPRRVFFTEQLPRNAMGKVQKAALRETYADASAASP